MLLALVVMILGLSGCFESRQEVTVKADGTGRVIMHAELDKRALATVARTFGRGAVDLQALRFRVVDQTFPDGTKVRTTDDAERSVLDASFDFDGSDDYRRKMAQINEAVTEDAVGSGPSGGSLEVRRVGDRMEVAIDLGGLPQDLESIDVSAMREVLAPDVQPKVTIAVTMPGSILSSNGTVNGRTVAWDLLTTGLPGTLQASSDIARPGLPAWALPAAAGIMLALALAAVGIILSRRARRSREPVVPYQPGPAQPPGPAGAGFPAAPAGLPPREPLEWPQEAAAPSVWAVQQPPASPPPRAQADAPPPAPPLAGSADGPPLVPIAPSDAPSGMPPPDAPPLVRITPSADATPPDSPPAAPPPEQPSPPQASIWGSRAPAATAGSSPEEARPWRVAPVAPAEPAGGPPLAPSPPDPPTPPAQPDRTGGMAPEPAGAATWSPSEGGGTSERHAPDPAPTAGARGEPEPAVTEAVPAAPAAPAPAPTGPIAGWYADPAGSGGLRYWDGSRWTRDTR